MCAHGGRQSGRAEKVTPGPDSWGGEERAPPEMGALLILRAWEAGLGGTCRRGWGRGA